MLRTIWPKYFLLGKKQARNPGRLRKGLQIAVVGLSDLTGLTGWTGLTLGTDGIDRM